MKELENSPTEDDNSVEVASCREIPSGWLRLGASDSDTADSEITPAVTEFHTWPSVPGYDLLEELGRGAGGVVFRAWQHNPRRTVALKMLLNAHLGDDTLARFRQESDSLACLQHPGIVRVFEVSVANGQPYFSMEYFSGGTLAKRISGTPLPPREAADIAAQLAEAAQKAHDAGIVHRDLKPGNVLLAGNIEPRSIDDPSRKSNVDSVRQAPSTMPALVAGSPVVKISDFGLAKHLNADTTRTRSGAILGTPSYMAPEQADETSAVTPAADIWSIGAVLYEMLTGRPPFKGAAILDTLDQVRHRQPVPPSSLNLRTPRDLETICLKCLEKDPRKRYATSAALAHDIRRWLAGRPIAARRLGPIGHLTRWCRRRPGLAALSAFALMAMIALIAGGIVYSRRLGMAEGDKRAADSERRAAEELTRIAREGEAAHRYRSKVDAARELLAERRLGWRDAAATLLEEAAQIETEARDPVELRSGITSCFTGVDLCEPRSVCPGMVPGTIAFAPGEPPLLAVGQFRGILLSPLTIQVADIASDKAVWNFRVYAKPVVQDGQLVPDGIQAVEFSPDRRWLIAGTRAGSIYRWDLKAEQPESISFSAYHSRGVHRLMFAADGRTLYSMGAKGKLLRWEIKADWKQSAEFSAAPHEIEDVAELANGRIVVAAGGKLLFLDPKTLATAADPFPISHAGMMSLRRASDTLAIAMGRQVGIVALDDAPVVVRKLRDPFGETLCDGRLSGVLFSPDGSLLVTAAHSEDDRRLKIWDSANGRLIAALFVPGSGPIDPKFSPDGKRLALIAGRKTLVYRVERSDVIANISLSAQPVRAFDWSPDGSELALMGLGDAGNGYFAISRFADGTVRHRLLVSNQKGTAIPNVAWSKRGSLAWNGAGAGLTVASAKDPQRSTHQIEGVQPLAMTFDSSGDLWGTVQGRLHHWEIGADAIDVRAGKLIWDNRLADIFRGGSEISDMAAGPTRVVLATRDGGLYLARIGAAQPDRLLMTNFDPLQCVAMTADESLIMAGSRGGRLHICDGKSATPIEEVEAATDSLDAVAIAPDAKLFATGTRDGVLKLWRWSGRAELLLTVTWPTPIRKLRFSPDGTRLAVLHTGGNALRIWHIDRLKNRLEQHGLGW